MAEIVALITSDCLQVFVLRFNDLSVIARKTARAVSRTSCNADRQMYVTLIPSIRKAIQSKAKASSI